MALLLSSPPKTVIYERRFSVNNIFRSNRSAVVVSKRGVRRGERRLVRIQACFDPFGGQSPIVRDALKEPVAFMGGLVAGLLRLDLNEDPLKEWISRTVEASGIAEEVQTGVDGSEQNGEDDTPQQILIE
ncbi:hypothetical protein LUZ61_010224 [Rhynchospora tenuis]|uniref:Uncharacterized protein n=1 Tax=Rhynchospora tenuis TaxID=198213 RepID=A0AAD5ZYQ0_9POAL|nr:hypothetical protein LUZ61_010224 [Rhynchospora tenuis]